jgi:Domain of unknown function (DUF6531)
LPRAKFQPPIHPPRSTRRFQVRDLAGTFDRFADDVGSALRDIRGLEGDSVVQQWVGQSGDAYRDQFGEAPWWENAVDWVVDHWDEIITVCKWVVAIGGIIVMIIGGPLAWVIVGIAVLVLADTIRKYAQGKATLWQVAFAALDCIPITKGLTSLGRLKDLYKLGGLRAIGGAGLAAARGRLGSIANGVRGAIKPAALRSGLTNFRQNAVAMMKRVTTGDPIDVATGEMVQQQTDVELPGLLPLTLVRTHVSGYRVGRWFGPSWASTLDQRIEVDAGGVCYAAADGMLLACPTPNGDASVFPAEGPRWPLARADEGFTVDVPERGHTLHFAPTGHSAADVFPLAAVADRNGHRIDFDYAPDGTVALIGMPPVSAATPAPSGPVAFTAGHHFDSSAWTRRPMPSAG